MTEGPKFNSPEEEIAYLERRILDRKTELAERGGHEIVKEVIKQHTSEEMEEPEKMPGEALESAVVHGTQISTEEQIAPYVELALREGPIAAVRAVRKIHNPHMVDELHDALAGRLLERLREQGHID